MRLRSWLRWLRRLFCEHEWRALRMIAAQGRTPARIAFRCRKCGTLLWRLKEELRLRP